jgi:hypothetical protein
MTFLDTNYKWPKKGDRLLRAGTDWRRSVTFEEQQVTRHVFIWDGYMKAGAALIDQCKTAENRTDRHELVYPILFCYRYGLELAIKWIIDRYGRYASIPKEDHIHHNLLQLWRVCKQVILEVGSDGETEALLAVEQVVKDFHDIDRASFSFRYSTDTNGVVIALPSDAFDLENVKHVMDAVNNLFAGADGQLDHNSRAASW